MTNYYLVVSDKETYDRILTSKGEKLEPFNIKKVLTPDNKYEYYCVSWRLKTTYELILKKYYHADTAEWTYMVHEDLAKP